MAIFITFFGLIILVFVPVTVAYRLWISPLSTIPGPFWARCSILWKFWHVRNNTYSIALRRAHEKHGQFVRIAYNEVSVCNDEALKKVLVPHYNKPAWYSIFGMPDTTYVNQMSQRNAAKYIETRKKIAPGYSPNVVLKNEDQIDMLIDRFHSMAKQVMRDTGRIAPAQLFTFFAYDVLGSVTFSHEMGFLKEQRDINDHVATSEQLCQYMSIFGFFPAVHDYLSRGLGPLLAWLDIEPGKKVLGSMKAHLQQHDEAYKQGHSKTAVDMVSAWRAYQGSKPLTERQIYAACLGSVAAGGDTVGGVAQAIMWYIMQNPTVKDKLYTELMKARANGTLSSPVQYAETLKLPYFQLCLKEALRMHPVGATGMGRVAPAQGIEIAGFLFPEGTILNVNQWALHYDKAVFGEDAWVYKPERWLKADTVEMDRFLIPFSSGYMTCPGRHLAIIEMSKLLVTLFLEYDISLADPEKQWHLEESVITKPSGWEVKLQRRGKENLETGS